LEAIRSVPGAHESRTVRAEEGKWTTVAPGARTKVLTKEAARMSFLLDLDPHATLPAHDHEGGEDSYVIRGSCHIGALALHVGDFHHADATAHHGDVVASADGCLLLITVARAAA
jgi:anti-sigma factor ChrR (cupin superfamily)